jgi:regulator of RNase E activity RraA
VSAGAVRLHRERAGPSATWPRGREPSNFSRDSAGCPGRTADTTHPDGLAEIVTGAGLDGGMMTRIDKRGTTGRTDMPVTREETLLTCRRELYTAVIADTLDVIGLHDQTVAPGLAPLDEGMRIAGFVRVGIYMPIFHDDERVDVYEHEIRLVDDLKPGEVPVLVCNGDVRISPWGELLSTRARYLGAAGCITDGAVRDVDRICDMDFPVFSAARNPVDTKYRGKMMWTDVPARIGGVAIASGDLVMADRDGIVFVPSGVIDQVLEKALRKVRTETTVRDELRAGATLADVFARHGIL